MQLSAMIGLENVRVGVMKTVSTLYQYNKTARYGTVEQVTRWCEGQQWRQLTVSASIDYVAVSQLSTAVPEDGRPFLAAWRSDFSRSRKGWLSPTSEVVFPSDFR